MQANSCAGWLLDYDRVPCAGADRCGEQGLCGMHGVMSEENNLTFHTFHTEILYELSICRNSIHSQDLEIVRAKHQKKNSSDKNDLKCDANMYNFVPIVAFCLDKQPGSRTLYK